MEQERSYTLGELERETDTDRRTIVYYVQEGLLPRVGRRGPRTRYPRLFRDRLLFIRRLRELQDAGRVGSMTLAEIRELFERVPEATIAAVADGREPLEVLDLRDPKLQASMASPRLRAERMRVSEELLMGVESPRMDAYHQGPPEEDDLRKVAEAVGHVMGSPTAPAASERSVRGRVSRLGELLARLERAAGRRRWGAAGRSEHWTRAEVTPQITVSARGLDEEDAELLEEVARALRREMVGGGSGEG